MHALLRFLPRFGGQRAQILVQVQLEEAKPDQNWSNLVFMPDPWSIFDQVKIDQGSGINALISPSAKSHAAGWFWGTSLRHALVQNSDVLCTSFWRILSNSPEFQKNDTSFFLGLGKSARSSGRFSWISRKREGQSGVIRLNRAPKGMLSGPGYGMNLPGQNPSDFGLI